MREKKSVVTSDLIVKNADVAIIQSKICLIRDVQVMLDRDLAKFYGVEVRVLNQAVKRNIERFPPDFMFQLTEEECSRSQIVTLNGGRGNNIKYRPYAFTENGIAMLSSVLRSATAIDANIRIMRAFVAMRKLLLNMAPMMTRVETIERQQLIDRQKQVTDQERNEARFETILNAMQDKSFPPQKIFFDGQVYDAKAFATKYILSAKKSILLIDNWVDSTTLEMLSKKKAGVTVEIVTSQRGNRITKSELAAFNEQYGGLTIRISANFHDRFVIIDDKALYLFGASLKDLGKKCFAFTRLDPAEIPHLKARI